MRQIRTLFDNKRAPPLPASLVQEFFDRFVVDTTAYAVQRRDGSYTAFHHPLTTTHLDFHFRKLWTLATYAAYEPQAASKWVCLDSDAPDGRERLLVLQGALAGCNGWGSLYELSRRGAHLWIFLDSDSYFRDHALRLLNAIRTLHFWQKADLFPKPRGMGGCVRLPLGVHRKSGQVYPVRHHETGELLLGEAALRYIVSIPTVSTTKIIASYAT